MRPIVRVNNLGKRYRIGRYVQRTLRESIMDFFAAPVRYVGGGIKRITMGPHLNGSANGFPYVWALKSTSFDVMPGEILGIIGRNGAGKSTLLKILSRVTEPTEGTADVYGRVGSLLEVGTGFHSELTGRENIYLSGAILGMKRAEIERKFDEIVAFAEVEKFIDTPVKHYSSGMYVRLGFAVAAHLEPQILLVDEVLAVGDTRFYQKSTKKMRALNAAGMTILLVTHNMWLVQTVCSRAILIDGGRIVAEGKPIDVISTYRRNAEKAEQFRNPDLAASKEAEILGFQIFPMDTRSFDCAAAPNSGVRIVMTARVSRHPQIKFLVRVCSPDGFPYFTVYSDPVELSPNGLIECESVISNLMLMPGEYVVWGGVCSRQDEGEILAEANLPLAVASPDGVDGRFGIFRRDAQWRIRGLNPEFGVAPH